MKRLLQLGLLVMTVAVFTGCASTTQYVRLPDQTMQVEDPSKARLYVVRPTSMGGAIPMKVSDGDKLIGKTGPKGYLCWERAPGEVEIVGKAENEARLPVTVEQGTVYYIQQHVRMGILMARTKLSLLTEEDGKAKVAKSKAPTVQEQ